MAAPTAAPLPWQIDPPGQQKIIQLGAEQQQLAQPQGRGLQAQVNVGSAGRPGMAISISSVDALNAALPGLSRSLTTASRTASREPLMPLTSWSTRTSFNSCQLSSWGIQRPESTPAPPAHSEDAAVIVQALQPAHIRFRHGCRRPNSPSVSAWASAGLEDNATTRPRRH